MRDSGDHAPRFIDEIIEKQVGNNMRSSSSKRFIPISANILACFLLFFCIPFIAAFYSSTTAEYDLNQKIDRGFISREAVFFSVGKINSDVPDTVSSTSEEIAVETSLSEKTAVTIEKDAAENAMDEVLRSCSGENIFLASQNKTTRAVYYDGDAELPPILSGRFLTSEECQSDQKFAVIGKNLVSETWQDATTNQTFIMLLNQQYEVIGVAGLNTVSTIDDLSFVNIGSITSEAQLSGRFYMDGKDKEIQDIFSRISNLVNSEDIYQILKIEMPMTATDVVAGGIFMADILKIVIYLFLAGAYFCILTFFLLSNMQKISVFLLNGYPYRFVISKTFLPMMMAGLSGIFASFLSFFFLWRIHFFALPVSYYIACILKYGLIGFLLLILWIIPVYFLVHRFKLAESLR